MKNVFMGALLLVSSVSFAGVPNARVTWTDTYNGYATIAGVLTAPTNDAVGVTVDLGGIKSSTITDRFGNWSLVVRLTGTSYSAKTFAIGSSNGEGEEVIGQIK